MGNNVIGEFTAMGSAMVHDADGNMLDREGNIYEDGLKHDEFIKVLADRDAILLQANGLMQQAEALVQQAQGLYAKAEDMLPKTKETQQVKEDN